MSRITVTYDGLESVIERIVDERLAEALGARPEEDPWLDSAAAADYLGVKRQRICAGCRRSTRGRVSSMLTSEGS
jgi:hypothetical protein